MWHSIQPWKLSQTTTIRQCSRLRMLNVWFWLPFEIDEALLLCCGTGINVGDFRVAYPLSLLADGRPSGHFSSQSRRDNCILVGGGGAACGDGGWLNASYTDFAIADTTVNANLSIYCNRFSMERASVKANVGSFTYVKHSAVQHLENTSIWCRFVGFLPLLEEQL